MSSWHLRADYAQRVEDTADALGDGGFGANLGVVLGSGLGNFADLVDVKATREFDQIDGFHAPTVVAHSGMLLQAQLPKTGVPLLVLQGRLHAYEGHPMEDVVFPIATLMALGVETLILTNAAGGLSTDMHAGDVMAITGLIDFHWQDPLRGLVAPSEDAPLGAALRGSGGGPFDVQLARKLVEVGAAEGIAVRMGTYLSVWGPSYETPAEIGMLRRLGADAVGMSTAPEAALAAGLGARVVGMSLITNVAREAAVETIDHQEVIAVGNARRDDLARLLLAFLASLEPDS